MKILICSAGRRAALIQLFKESAGSTLEMIAIDNDCYAPALQMADKCFQVPLIADERYIPLLIDICKKENICAIFTMIDPEIELLALHRQLFDNIGIRLFVPSLSTAQLCFDKFVFYEYLTEHDISTVLTFDSIAFFAQAFEEGVINFPVFVKPRKGSASVGARTVFSMDELEMASKLDPTLIIQEYMDCDDVDVDAYVDAVSGETVRIFSKLKLETRIGGASKTVSFHDKNLDEFVVRINKLFSFVGPINMDFFRKDGKYYISEINPRFGGGYLHAHGAGVNFIDLIVSNIQGLPNDIVWGEYPEGHVMMMYDAVVFGTAGDLVDKDCREYFVQ